MNSDHCNSIMERPSARSAPNDQPLQTPDHTAHRWCRPQHGRLPPRQLSTNAPTTLHNPHPHGPSYPTPPKSTRKLRPSESVNVPPRRLAQPQSCRSLLQTLQILSNMGSKSSRPLDQIRSPRPPDPPTPRRKSSFQHSAASQRRPKLKHSLTRS